MRLQMIIILVSVLLTACGLPPSSAHDRLALYFDDIPQQLTINKYYESNSPAMDHTYCWEIAIIDNEAFKQFGQQIISQASNVDGIGPDTGLIGHSLPDWWDEEYLRSLEGYRFAVANSGQSVAMFDRSKGLLYIQVND